MEQQHQIIDPEGMPLIEGSGPIEDNWDHFVAAGHLWRIRNRISLRVRRDGAWVRLDKAVAIIADPVQRQAA